MPAQISNVIRPNGDSDRPYRKFDVIRKLRQSASLGRWAIRSGRYGLNGLPLMLKVVAQSILEVSNDANLPSNRRKIVPQNTIDCPAKKFGTNRQLESPRR